MRMLLLVTAFVSAAVSTHAAFVSNASHVSHARQLSIPSTCPVIELNVDYLGNDIGTIPGADDDECCAHCTFTNGCHAITWSAGVCYLKSGKGATAFKAGVRSGSIAQIQVPSPCPVTYTNTDYIGNDIGQIASQNYNECCSHCHYTTGCGAFSYSPTQRVCYLKTGKTATAYNPGVYSGALARVRDAVCPVTEINVDFVGNDIGSIAGANADDCCVRCASVVGCHAFSLSQGVCYLKSGKGAIKYVAGVVSAELR